MQGFGPRKLAETGPIPKVYRLAKKIFYSHRFPLCYGIR
jgi:hypothetical protein